MFTLKIENRDGDVLELTNNESRYQVVGITGLNPPNASIRRTTVALADGSQYVSSNLEERNVVLTVAINGDVEYNRIRLYDFVRTRQWCKLYYRNGARDVYIEGYVETNECDLFGSKETMQVSIICPNPYFQSLYEIVTDISQVIGAFTFPFAFGSGDILYPTVTDSAIEFSTYMRDRISLISNAGSDGTGMIIKITFVGNVGSPIIYNVMTQEFFGLTLVFMSGDVVTINTNAGQKKVTLLRNGQETNIINFLKEDSTWLTLKRGDNLFQLDASSNPNSMEAVFTHRTRYEAV